MSRPRKLLLLALAILAAGGGAIVYRHHHRYKHFAVHDQGMVYRSAWVEPDVFAELIDKHQIRAVVNLCNPQEMGEARSVAQRAAVRGAGARLYELPFPNTIDPADPGVARVVEVLSDPSNYPMLVHCQHGVTRTAKVLAMYDVIHRGMSSGQSLGAMPLFGRDGYSVSVWAFARGFEQQHRKLYPQAVGKLEALRR
jgi:protein-tyrosine phosphatase